MKTAERMRMPVSYDLKLRRLSTKKAMTMPREFVL